MPSLRRMTPRCRVCETRIDSDTPEVCACGLQTGTVMESKSTNGQFYIVKMGPKSRKRYWAKYSPSSSSTFRDFRRSSYSRRGSRVNAFLNASETIDYNRLFKAYQNNLVDLLIDQKNLQSSRAFKLVEKMHDKLVEYVSAYVKATFALNAFPSIAKEVLSQLGDKESVNKDNVEKFVNHLMNTFTGSELNKMKRGVNAFFNDNKSEILISDKSALKVADNSIYTILRGTPLSK